MMLKNYLPTKKFTLTILSVLIILGLIFLIIYSRSKKITFNKNKNNSGLTTGSEGIILSDLIEKDTDEDGLKDWEEVLWGTDPQNKDTNGDGILDGIEAGEIRDMLLPKTEQGEISGDEEILSETESFAKEIFVSWLALSQSGNLNEETTQAFFENITSSITEKGIDSITFTTSDIVIYEEENFQTVGFYIFEINEFLKKYSLPKKENNPILILASFLENENKEELARLDPIIKKSKEYFSKLLKTTIPDSAIPFHLNLVNSLQNYLDGVEAMALMEEDPMIAILGLSQYEKSLTEIEQSLDDMGLYVEIKKELGI